MALEARHLADAELSAIPGPFGHLSEAGADAYHSEFLGASIRALLAC